MPLLCRSSQIESRVRYLLDSEDFEELKAAGVTVDVLEAFPDDDGEDEHALFHQGYAANALVKLTSYERRALGQADALILVDASAWERASAVQRDALLHHELYHLELVRDRHGAICFDKADRPRLKLRLHDVQIGWFERTAQLYGSESFEISQARRLVSKHRQTLFSWLDEEVDSQAEKKAEVGNLLGALIEHHAAEQTKRSRTKTVTQTRETHEQASSV